MPKLRSYYYALAPQDDLCLLTINVTTNHEYRFAYFLDLNVVLDSSNGVSFNGLKVLTI